MLNDRVCIPGKCTSQCSQNVLQHSEKIFVPSILEIEDKPQSLGLQHECGYETCISSKI